jgi:hypothetical protein
MRTDRVRETKYSITAKLLSCKCSKLMNRSTAFNDNVLTAVIIDITPYSMEKWPIDLDTYITLELYIYLFIYISIYIYLLLTAIGLMPGGSVYKDHTLNKETAQYIAPIFTVQVHEYPHYNTVHIHNNNTSIWTLHNTRNRKYTRKHIIHGKNTIKYEKTQKIIPLDRFIKRWKNLRQDIW